MSLFGRDKRMGVRSVRVSSIGPNHWPSGYAVWHCTRIQKPHALEWCNYRSKSSNHIIKPYLFNLRSLNAQTNWNQPPKGTFNTLHVPVSSMQGQPFASLAQVSICRHLLVVLPCHTCIFSVGIDDLRYGDPAGMIPKITPPPAKKKTKQQHASVLGQIKTLANIIEEYLALDYSMMSANVLIWPST